LNTEPLKEVRSNLNRPKHNLSAIRKVLADAKAKGYDEYRIDTNFHRHQHTNNNVRLKKQSKSVLSIISAPISYFAANEKFFFLKTD